MFTLVAYSNRLKSFAFCDESPDLDWLKSKMQMCACAFIEDERGGLVCRNGSVEEFAEAV